MSRKHKDPRVANRGCQIQFDKRIKDIVNFYANIKAAQSDVMSSV